ncbi:alpha/beta fold hydrolase [Shewanella acanthi]|uniref:alpha/beta fold hydrolase n=1 Tax=Shewanella acanthi TaxID=2864212 RepID=UPI001C656149|nr:alpha/beta fold hydrolase [Shewanella acanthi]QYJ80588.1 alpha/beta fold hydrolase [Shewanella acanthi]
MLNRHNQSFKVGVMDFSIYRQQVNIDNKQLSYLDIGSGPVLLFGHCFLWDSLMWAPQIEMLSQHYRCIVPDLWGHGASDSMPENTKSLLDIAEHMLQLMDSLGVAEFNLIGLSVGAMWGAELVLKAPDRVKSIVMLDSFIGYEPEITRTKYLAMLDKIQAEGNISTPLIQQISPLFFADNASIDSAQIVEQFEQYLASLKAEQLGPLIDLGRLMFSRRDTMDFAEQFTLPCLIMVGIEDKSRTVLESYLMHDAIDGSEFVHIPNAGHISNLEQSDFVSAKISDFLARLN